MELTLHLVPQPVMLIIWLISCMKEIPKILKTVKKIDSGLANTVRMSVQDRVAGELAEIYHEDFPIESGGWQDAQIVWHDLDYHGESGGVYGIIYELLLENIVDPARLAVVVQIVPHYLRVLSSWTGAS